MQKITYYTMALALVGLLGCEETPQPVDPCSDNEWATAMKNGTEVCMADVQVTYFHPNTTSAVIVFTAGNDVKKEIDAEFSIPVEGIALNKDYPLKSGTIFGADVFTEGKIRFIDFDLAAPGKSGCITGTFSLTAAAPDAPVTISYTAGKFVYFKGTVKQDDQDGGSACNPFK